MIYVEHDTAKFSGNGTVTLKVIIGERCRSCTQSKTLNVSITLK